MAAVERLTAGGLGGRTVKPGMSRSWIVPDPERHSQAGKGPLTRANTTPKGEEPHPARSVVREASRRLQPRRCGRLPDVHRAVRPPRSPAPRRRPPDRAREPCGAQDPTPGTRRARRTRASRCSSRSTARCPGSAHSARDRLVEARPAVEHELAAAPSPPRSPASASWRAVVRPSVREVGAGDGPRRRELVREPERRDAAHGPAELLDERAGERGRAADRDLLAEDRPHAELERIERARDAQPLRRAHERARGARRARGGGRSTFGSASRSNRRRTPATRCTSPSIAGRCTRRRSACSRGTSHTSITPGAPSMSATRR